MKRTTLSMTLSLSLLAACQGEAPPAASSGAAATAAAPADATTTADAGTPGDAAQPQPMSVAQVKGALAGKDKPASSQAWIWNTWFRGDGTSMPVFGGWAGSPPSQRVVWAGFGWFEAGYPGDSWSNETMGNGGVRPFAYINLGEISDDLWWESGYSGPILRDSAYSWSLHLVDVTHWSWQEWLVRRADFAYWTGSRGVKWDVPPDVPWGKSQHDVNAAIAEVMYRVRGMHPDMKFIFNQHFDFALEYPWLVDGMETEGLFSASSWGSAYLQPWNDPWWWGPQYDKARKLHDWYGIPIIVAEYADPWSGRAYQLHDAIANQGFVPYITNDSWNITGRALWTDPNW